MKFEYVGSALLILVLVLVFALQGCVAKIGEAISQSTTSYWNGKSLYEWTLVGTEAVRADTRAAHGLDTRVVLVVGLCVFFAIVFVAYGIWRDRQQQRMMRQVLELVRRPATDMPVVTVQKPERSLQPVQFEIVEAPHSMKVIELR